MGQSISGESQQNENKQLKFIASIHFLHLGFLLKSHHILADVTEKKTLQLLSKWKYSLESYSFSFILL